MQADLILSVVMWLCIGLAVLWLVLSLFGRWQRRTYSLTRAEAGGSAAQPEFLKVDHDKRREALAKATPAEAVEPAPPRSPYARLARYAATLFAVLTLIVASLKAITSLDEYTAMASEAATLVTDTDAMATAVRDYWPGILVAILVIIVQIGRVALTLRKS